MLARTRWVEHAGCLSGLTCGGRDNILNAVNVFLLLCGIAAERAVCQFGSMRLSRFFLTLVLLVVPAVVRAQREKLPPADLEMVQKTWPNAKRTSTGLRYVVLSEGKGDLAKSGEVVNVLYTGWLLDGTKFDQSIDPAKPFSFRVGRHQVIEGWDQGLQLMRVGEKRLFIVPYELGYGSLGHRPAIPPCATLVFEVELLEIKK